jgi:hypothetical protein
VQAHAPIPMYIAPSLVIYMTRKYEKGTIKRFEREIEIF